MQGGKRPVLKKCKILRKETEDTNKCNHIQCSWIGRINIIKMSLLPKAIRIQHNSYRITNGIFHRTRTNKPKIYMEPQVSK